MAADAHKFTGVHVQHLDDLLNGSPTLSVQFNFGDPFIHHPVDVDLSNPPRWTMPPELAGVLWVSNDYPFTTTCRPNPTAAAPAPPAFLGKTEDERSTASTDKRRGLSTAAAALRPLPGLPVNAQLLTLVV
ncbi:hypothetical protein [Streptomyces californicus]|uniref:hypothetical protein n=1 Tax=Streptomyces californicus TaxID=67351 RepID=UPI0033CD770E